jgi:hypothetical protein
MGSVMAVGLASPGATAVESHYALDPDYDPDANGELIPCGFEGKPL